MIDEPTMGADQGGGRALGAETLTGYMVQGMLRAPYKVHLAPTYCAVNPYVLTRYRPRTTTYPHSCTPGPAL